MFRNFIICLAAFLFLAEDSFAKDLLVDIREVDYLPLSDKLSCATLQTTFKGQWKGQVFTDSVESLALSMVRFPAGMDSMYYDWESGTYSGSGGRYTGKRKTENHKVDDFFNLAKKFKTDLSYVVNINQDSPEKTERLARYIKASGYEVYLWELGNESYASEFEDTIGGVKNYLKIAGSHRDVIKKIFPSARVAVTAKDQLFKYNLWNKLLARDESFDHVVTHRYVGPNQKDRKMYEGFKSQVDIKRGFKKLLSHSNPGDEPYGRIFEGKNIWVTEWNTLHIGMDLMNSLAHTLWVARTFVLYARNPDIKGACYWNMNASPFELFSDVEGKVVHRISYYTFKLFSEIFNVNSKSSKVRLLSKGKAERYVDGQIFVGSSGKKSLVVINSSGSKHSINVPVGFGIVDKAIIIGGSDLDLSNGYSIAFSENLRSQKEELVRPVEVSPKSNKVDLPEYGLVYITLKENKK